MEGDDAQPAARNEQIRHIVQSLPQYRQFLIDLYADRLKRSLRRMRPVLAGALRHRVLDDPDQLPGRFDRFCRPCFCDKISNPGSPALFSVFGQDTPQLLFAIFIYNIIGGKAALSSILMSSGASCI